MADDSREFLLRILVEALNKTKGGLDAAAKTAEGFRKGEEDAEEAHQKKMDAARKRSHDEELRRLREELKEKTKQRDAASKEAVRRLQKEIADKKSAADEEVRDRKRVEKKIEGSIRRRESLERQQARAAISRAKALGREVEKVVKRDEDAPSWLRRTADLLDRNQDSVAKLDNQLRGLATLAVIGFAQQLLTVLSSLAGAFTAVASSAAFAGTAVAAAMTSAAAQAVPAIGLIVAAFGRVGAVFDAVKQANKTGLGATRDAAAAMEQQRNAANRVRDAHEGVVDADRRVIETRRGVTEAVRESRRELEELADAERAAQQAAEGALLSLDESRRALRASVAEGDIEGGARAELAVQEAQTGLSQAVRDRDRTVADARRRRRQGVGGAEGVQSATRQLREAERAADKARRSLREAQHDADVAGAKTSAAATKLNELLAQLSPAERKLYEALIRLQDRYRAAFRPITDILVRAFTRGVDDLTRLVGDPRITKPFTMLADSMAGAMDRVRGMLTSDESVRFFGVMTREAARSQGPIASIAINLFKLFRNVAEAGIPAFRLLLRFFERLTDSWARGTSNTRELSRFFLEGARHAIAWVRLGGAVIRLFAALAGAGGARTGLDLVEDLTGAANRATDSIHRNSEAVEGFFKDSREVMHQLGRVVVALAKAIAEAFDPETVKALTDFLVDVFIPALSIVIETFGELTKWFLRFLDLPLVRELAKIGLAIAVGSLAMQKMTGVIAIFVGGFEKAVLAVRALVGWLARLRGAQLATAAPGFIDSRRGPQSPATGVVPVPTRDTGRRRRVARGVGIAALIGGGIAADQLASDDFRQARGFEGVIKGLSGAARQLTSLDFGGFIHRFTQKGSKDLEAFGRSADSAFKTALKKRDVGALRTLADTAREMAKRFPEYSEGLEKFAGQVDKAIKVVRNRIAQSNIAKDAISRFAGALINGREVIGRSVGRFLSTLDALPPGARRRTLRMGLAIVSQLERNRQISGPEADKLRDRIMKPLNDLDDQAGRALRRVRRKFSDHFAALVAGINVDRNAQVLLQMAEDSPAIFGLQPLSRVPRRPRRPRRAGGWAGSDVLLSPGEEVVEPTGQSWVVPGVPTAADTYAARVPEGSGILTWSGQAMRQMGATLSQAISGQMPHFRRGGYVQGAREPRGRPMQAVANFLFGRGFSATSGGEYRGTGTGHDQQWATDWGNSANNLRSLWRVLFPHRGQIEELYGPSAFAGLYERGRKFFNSGLQSDHEDHIHLGVRRAISGLGRVVGRGVRDDPGAAPARTRRVPIMRDLFRSVAPSTSRGVRGLESLRSRARGTGPLGRFATGVFDDVRALGTALRQDLSERIRVGTRTITTGRVLGSDRARVGDASLQSINRMFKKHYTGQPGEAISAGMAQRLARWARLPSWFPRIWKGESTFMPGIVNSRDGGIGLGQETPSSWGPNWRGTTLGRHMMKLGGYEAMRNPLKQALMNRFHYQTVGKQPGQRGFPWYGTQFLRGGGWVGRQKFQGGGHVAAAADPIAEVLRAFGLVGRTTTSYVRRTLPRARDLSRAITNLFADIVGDGGFFDRLTTRIESLRTEVASGIQRTTFQIGRSGQLIRRRLSPEQIAGRELAGLQDEYELLVGERGALATQLRNARRALKLAGKDAKARRAAQRAINNVLDRIRSVDTSIGDAVSSIGEAAENALSSVVEQVNDTAQRWLGVLDLRGRKLDMRGRLADLMEAAGFTSGAFHERDAVLAERGQILREQRPLLLQQQAGLQGAFQTAVEQGNTALARDLYDQLGEVAGALQENLTAIAENAAAIKANTSAYRSARIENITRRGGFLSGTFGGLGSLLEAAAAATGGQADLSRQRGLIEQTIAALTGTGASLRTELFGWLGIDLRGLDPTALVDRLRALDFDRIEATLSVEDRGQFESLVGAIIENATTVQQNTDQLRQLNAPNAQGFTSTAWTWFRNAIFNGAGGLLPQFQVPSAQAGAMITRGGLVLAHAGEEIRPATTSPRNGSQLYGDVEANIYVTEEVEDADPDVMANRLIHRLRHGSH